MSTDLKTEADLPCRYRGVSMDDNRYECDIHGTCSLDIDHPRVRPCITCTDRIEGPPPEDPKMFLGDRVEGALRTVGITKERVTEWLGHDCHCDEAQEKLNQLDRWARRIIAGKVERGKELLERIME